MIDWITEENFDRAVNQLTFSALKAMKKSDKNLKKNVVDPFSAILIAVTFKIDQSEELKAVQQAESSVRGMSNALGKFHQTVLGSVEGWDNHDAGYDLECVSENIIAEVKNKHNTMNAANRQKVEEDLKTALRQKKGNWEAYLVHIVPKTPVRYRKQLDKNFYEIDGASFYCIATGSSNALHDLFDCLCERIAPSGEIVSYCKEIMSSSIPPRL